MVLLSSCAASLCASCCISTMRSVRSALRPCCWRLRCICSCAESCLCVFFFRLMILIIMPSVIMVMAMRGMIVLGSMTAASCIFCAIGVIVCMFMGLLFYVKLGVLCVFDEFFLCSCACLCEYLFEWCV